AYISLPDFRRRRPVGGARKHGKEKFAPAGGEDDQTSEHRDHREEIAGALATPLYLGCGRFIPGPAARLIDSIEKIEGNEHRTERDTPGKPAALRHPPERHALHITEKQRRADRQKEAANIADHKNEEDGVKSGEATSIEGDPGPDQ